MHKHEDNDYLVGVAVVLMMLFIILGFILHLS